MPQSFLEEMDQLIRARYSLIYVVTWEEHRARKLLLQVGAKQKKAVFEWTLTDGLRLLSQQEGSNPGTKRMRKPLEVLNEILQSQAQALYVLRDFHTHLEAPEIVRQLRDLAHALRSTKKTIIFVSPKLNLPAELEKSISIVDMPLPSYAEMKALLDKKIGGPSRNFRVRLNDQERDLMIKAALGLTYAEAENAFARAIVDNGVLEIEDIDTITAEKKQVIRKTEVLEYCEVQDSLGSVGGMDVLKDWLNKRVRAFGEDARAYGLPQPKGILLMGVQGCGKSLVAKTIAASWRLPLLRMDMSRIFQGYIGSSEQNMRKAVTIAESIAPAVLWIDEIEKAFSGSDSSSTSDSGTTARVLGTFLTWIQEKTAPVFVVATANAIEGLPPELLRKGRLDEIFFVDLPHREERREIFGIHLNKIRRDPAKYDLSALSDAASGFSGAEIEQAIVSAMHESFFEERELETNDILGSIQDTVPLSTTMRERITKLREWSGDRARPVSSPIPERKT
jgi:ATP-dependent 26S proteasome regulatory subunit